MCMLSYFPGGVMPRRDHIENGAEVNPDGHGFAIVTKRRELIIRRGMNASVMIDAFMEARASNPEGPALFHSRIATSGLVDITGCHPFRVGQDNRTVVAHNGVLFSPPRDSLKSDTAIFADRMLPRFGSLDSPRKFAKLERFVGYGNKLVVLTVHPKRRKSAYIVNEQSGRWTSEGEWHSNSDYLGWSPKYSRQARTSRPWETEPWPCDICGTWNSVSAVTMVCNVCHSCNDCSMGESDCQCYYGACYNSRRDVKDTPPVGTGVWERNPATQEWERKPLALPAGNGWPGLND